MPFSIYENQEATERSFLWGFFGCFLVGSNLLALSCLYLAWHSEDEERIAEEEMLDLSEPDLDYTLGIQKERVVEYHMQQYGFRRFSNEALYEYLTEDLAYEKAMLEEIYEFPVSNILSNNCYIIPSDERLFSLWYELASEAAWKRESALPTSQSPTAKALLEASKAKPEAKLNNEGAQEALAKILVTPLLLDDEEPWELALLEQANLVPRHPWDTNGNL